MNGNDYLLIGIDGGASKVSAWQVRFDQDEYSLGRIHAICSYSDVPGFIENFQPVNIQQQLDEFASGRPRPTDDELQQGAVYIEGCARVIDQVVEESGAQKVVVGLGMPGLKTADRRGIAVVANGPRMLEYCDILEKRLALKSISLYRPIHQIGSDADYCGIGENYSADGLLRDIRNGYYLGGGTGVADAIKLNDQLLAFDQIKSWMAKSWELKNDDGRSLERFASAGGIQSIYADLANSDTASLTAEEIFPLQIAEMAVAGQQTAVKTFSLVSEAIARLLYERITTLYSGWQGYFSFMNPKRAVLDTEHPYRKTILERIIIGQRLGELMNSEAGCQVLTRPLIDNLQALVEESPVLDQWAKNHYTEPDDLIVTSRLREAPALGAGIDAHLALSDRTRAKNKG